MHLINRRRGARSSWPAPGAEPGNQDDLVFTVGPSRDVTDWFYMFQVCARIPVLRRYEGARRHTLRDGGGRERRRRRRGEKERRKEKEGGGKGKVEEMKRR